MNKARLKRVLQHADVSDPAFLGSGAWHDAWKVVKENRELVLRIPKDIAYGKSISFNEEELTAEYAATKLYYQSVNQAVNGAAPDFYEFYVSADLTYTLESYGGDQIDLHTMTKEQVLQIGKQIGGIYRKTDQVSQEISGMGYLTWTEEKGLHGVLEGELHAFIQEESAEHIADYETLCTVYPQFQDEKVPQALIAATELRNQQVVNISLVNQDASPENILLRDDQVCLIDPYPSLYAPRGMAGNFMNLYETFFLVLSQTERYKKHRFDLCEQQLKGMAEGFLAGYSEGNKAVIREVRGEQLLQLLETAFVHHQLLLKDITPEDIIRYGDRQAIEARLFVLCEELKRFAASQIK
ncbi:hypothetical protein [Exiguobacterium sp. s142]|uniref:hypothetical protein n=1 Tax=Exiguobacterium sp. s142 TaxID=2751222 RepID=UPI001BEA0345|nr:hypothetical protein [Exiguobacterium sp. s142]